ncbi:DUF397 domain-containing protein [Streptomyces alkaliphilus]|uniref:DUF397 domain-containing protein n=1 Tax=Streptomyces alkaliphilus TaxID=1472722 RepID=UPI00117C6150|nr:DUF397 domain-containing protein [Streptomyces alkaliphilus]MQS06030.1 DUF397 domain-containing protein [Streptomyces alkaliphilus]
MSSHRAWQKSSFSSTGTECIEISSREAEILIRESDRKNEILATTPERFDALINAVKRDSIKFI